MPRVIKYLFIPALVILVLPLTGAWVAGQSVIYYLSFPPKTRFVAHAEFSWSVFLILGICITLSVSPFILRAVQFNHKNRKAEFKTVPLPWWGYLSLFGTFFFWTAAWTKFSWFAPLQHHTFFPLWLSFIFFLNSLVYKRTETAPILKYRWRFLALFLISGAFWWFFEYLNRFVGNWYYTGSQYGPFQYFLLATLSFSTVLPAVESLKAYLMSFPLFQEGFQHFFKLTALRSKPFNISLLLMSATSLFLLSVFPDELFFLVWIAPFLIIVSFQALMNRPPILSDLERGDFTFIVVYAVAALICGFFWEMWNFFSLAKWIYSIPYVHAFEIFEMPVLGYAGYLPFGLECAVVIDLVLNPERS